MALINCSECSKVISDKALTCPNCGYPQSQDNPLVETIKEQEDLLPFPMLPDNLQIGNQITNWAFDAAIEGFFDSRENTLQILPSGKVMVILHTHGIQLMKGLHTYSIHNSQIISLKKTSQEEIVQKQKSVIGRAVVGGIILGPLGAIVGGMSGIGNKEKFINKQYFVINYWDIATKSVQTILISSSKDTAIDAFIARHLKEKELNKTENREAGPTTTPTWLIVLLIITIFSIILIIALN